MISRWNFRAASVAALALLAALDGGAGSAALGVCGPFTDVSDAAFCPFILEIFTLGITTGTTPTTYDPASGVTRLQMSAFLSRSVDGVLRRSGRAALMKKFWTPVNERALGLTPFDGQPYGVQFDGADLWVSGVSTIDDQVARVRASDGARLQTWTGASGAAGVLVARGSVYAAGALVPGRLYQIDPAQTAGAVTTVASNLGNTPQAIAFDGARIWTANIDSVSIVTPGASIPWTVTTLTAGFAGPSGALFDGANIWVSDYTATTLLKLDNSGAILQTVTLGGGPVQPSFDGTNIWVPNNASAFISVVRASTGAVLATLTGNGLDDPFRAAFDGQRVLVTNRFGNSVSLWKAADLTPLGSRSTGAGSTPNGVCSDGANFWITLTGTKALARF